MRPLVLSLVAVALVTRLALADPGVRVTYPQGITRVELDGSWQNCRYGVTRSEIATDFGIPMYQSDVLCIGSCFVDDRTAVAGQTYYYRFLLQLPDGSRVTFGPYGVLASPNPAARLSARAFPNPGNRAAQIELSVPGYGGPVRAQARIFDAAGRSVRLIHGGTLPRGITRVAWDGRGDNGRALDPGLYFLRLETDLGATVTRLQRLQ